MNEKILAKLKLAIIYQIRICSKMEMVYGKTDERTVLSYEVLDGLWDILAKAEGRCKA